MTDKQPMQASGGGGREGALDGVEDPNGSPAGSGGQSEGGAYPNPHERQGKKTGGFFGHGGQTEIDYSGPGDDDDRTAGNPNAVTGG